jgi:hypothetical protein
MSKQAVSDCAAYVVHIYERTKQATASASFAEDTANQPWMPSYLLCRRFNGSCLFQAASKRQAQADGGLCCNCHAGVDQHSVAFLGSLHSPAKPCTITTMFKSHRLL